MKPNNFVSSCIIHAITLLIVPSLCTPAQQDPSVPASYDAEIQAWHDIRITNRKQPVGWLSLVALDWLKEGKNSLESIGTITLEKEALTFDALPGIKATLRGNAFSSGVLRASTDRIEPRAAGLDVPEPAQ